VHIDFVEHPSERVELKPFCFEQQEDEGVGEAENEEKEEEKEGRERKGGRLFEYWFVCEAEREGTGELKVDIEGN